MILPDGPVVRAFASVGWQLGGDYRSLKRLYALLRQWRLRPSPCLS